MQGLKKNINIYITFDGLSDPLGQSQIIPYLNNLKITEELYLFSFEKKKLNNFYTLNKFIKHYSIPFENSKYKINKIFSLIRFFFLIFKETYNKNIKIIHCRGIYPSIFGIIFKKLKKAKLLYDMRGFGVEEKVDNNIINLNNFSEKFLFKILKVLEKKVITYSDEIVVLTQKAKVFLKSNYKINSHIYVIPCSVSYDVFKIKDNQKFKSKILLRFGISEEDKILLYVGSFGSYYLHNEMFNIFFELRKKINNLFFVIITNDTEKFNNFKKNKLSNDNMLIKKINWKNIPKIFEISDLSICLIKPSFAKIASTPTKVSESLAMGVPVIINKNIGDYDIFFEKENFGYILKDQSLKISINDINEIKKLLKINKKNLRIKSKKYYCLEKAIKKYRKIYEILN